MSRLIVAHYVDTSSTILICNSRVHAEDSLKKYFDMSQLMSKHFRGLVMVIKYAN